MTRKSLIITHPNKLSMERSYLQGKSIASIARENEVGEESLRNHLQNNLSRQLIKAYEQKELTSSLDTLSEIDQIIMHTKEIFKRNYDKGKDITALKALDSQRSTLELLCKISAYLHQTKLLELQEKQVVDSEVANEELQKKLHVLTKPELKMLLRIQQKLESGDKKDIIIPEQSPTFDNNDFLGDKNERYTLVAEKEDQSLFRMKPPFKAELNNTEESIDQDSTIIQPNSGDNNPLSKDDLALLESIKQLKSDT